MKECTADRLMSLGDHLVRQYRFNMISKQHIKPITDFIALIRDEKAPRYKILNFDPMDGGIKGD